VGPPYIFLDMNFASTQTLYGKEPTVATSLEQDVRDFSAQFPTPNVKLMIQLCETGQISWAQAYEIARDSLSEGLGEVA
jgi:hypothetical protein